MISAERLYKVLGNESLWNITLDCDRIFGQAGISHMICGGVAVCLLGPKEYDRH